MVLICPNFELTYNFTFNCNWGVDEWRKCSAAIIRRSKLQLYCWKIFQYWIQHKIHTSYISVISIWCRCMLYSANTLLQKEKKNHYPLLLSPLDNFVSSFCCFFIVKRWLGIRSLFSARFILHSKLYNGVCIYPNLFCCEGPSAAWHQEKTTEINTGTGNMIANTLLHSTILLYFAFSFFSFYILVFDSKQRCLCILFHS